MRVGPLSTRSARRPALTRRPSAVPTDEESAFRDQSVARNAEAITSATRARIIVTGVQRRGSTMPVLHGR